MPFLWSKLLLHRHSVGFPRCCTIVLWIIMNVIAVNTEAIAQSWKAGKSLLLSGNYAGAEAKLAAATRASKSPQEKAESLKYLGVAQYMQKKESQAATSFKTALKLNPKLKLLDSEVADESVLPFFNRQKGLGSPPPTSTAKASAPNVKKSKKTLVRVVSNVSNAQISVDGIAYGTAGSDIEVKPGTVILDVTAPGYIKKSVKINVAANTANTLTVNLEKPQPKAPPPPKAVANEVPKGIPLPSTSGSSKLKTKAVGKKGGDLFAAEPGSSDDFSSIPEQPLGLAPNPAAQAQSIAPPAAPAQPVLPPGAYASPYQQQPMYAAPPPQYQQPLYQQQPMYQQPLYQQPAYPQPQYGPAYPQSPYGYQQPAPPSAYSPYGGGYQQPPQTQMYDPGFVAPPLEPNMSPQLPPPVNYGQPPPMMPPSEAKSKGKKTGSNKKSDGCSAFVKLLPLGAGQFCQGAIAKGVIVLGAQLGGIYFYKSNADAQVRDEKALKAYVADREQKRATESDTAAFDQETDQKIASANKQIESERSNQNLSLAVFGGAWAVGVADAFLFPPTTKSKKTTKKAKLSLNLDFRQDHRPLLAYISSLPQTVTGMDDAVWYAGYSVPTATHDAGAVRIGIAWDL